MKGALLILGRGIGQVMFQNNALSGLLHWRLIFPVIVAKIYGTDFTGLTELWWE